MTTDSQKPPQSSFFISRGVALALLLNDPIVDFSMTEEPRQQCCRMVAYLTDSPSLYAGFENEQRHAAAERLKDIIGSNHLTENVILSVRHHANSIIAMVQTIDIPEERERCHKNFDDFLELQGIPVFKEFAEDKNKDCVVFERLVLNKIPNTFHIYELLKKEIEKRNSRQKK